MLPEGARERDVYKYYQPWLDAQSLVAARLQAQAEHDASVRGLTYKGYVPESSRDKALTAFAQLAALRLDTRRAMVSLIDATDQYILAEATKTLSLRYSTAEKAEDQVWLGTSRIKAEDAICPNTFGSKYTAEGSNGETYTTEALVVPDCREDERFAEREYVKGEPG
ncbi:hypothetical protein LTS18_003869, partial [Coniosporium uncinatum]